MITLSEEEILSLHEKLMDRYSGPDGVRGLRDRKALDSALNAPFQTFNGEDLYPSVIEKAVRLGYGLVVNHPFIDGNKRVGTMAMLMLLRLNNVSLSYDQDDLLSIMLAVASGKADVSALLSWVLSHQSQ